MENGHFLKVIYLDVTACNFINKSCPIFDDNKSPIVGFCSFLQVFLQSEPKKGKILTIFGLYDNTNTSWRDIFNCSASNIQYSRKCD